MVSTHGVTQLLIEWRNGNRSALDQLLPLVYGELQLIAHGHLSRQGNGHTLQTADLVHEAYLRLVRQQETDWQDRLLSPAIFSRRHNPVVAVPHHVI
jgi:DNA-directed RNA polymerase specialized sigma24 family protein